MLLLYDYYRVGVFNTFSEFGSFDRAIGVI